ncbi:MAG TPA: YlbF family regulator [Roseimicrobium sp.]|nr:YlbF family regulator [Roseimicrobium sp.]
MTATTTESIIVEKTRELCQTLIEQPEFQTIRSSVETFLANDEARAQFDALNLKGQTLQQKQQAGLPLSEAEIADFESTREKLLANPVASNFLKAQEEMNGIQDQINQHVSKTFELGRVPNAEDFDSCCNEGGCGCH